LKQEALDRTLWRTRFGRGYGPIVRQTTEWMNTWWRSCTSMCFVSHQNIFSKFRLCLIVLKTGNLRFDLLRQLYFNPYQSIEILTSHYAADVSIKMLIIQIVELTKLSNFFEKMCAA
jgi:hypothetical protein